MPAFDLPPDETGIRVSCAACAGAHFLRLDGYGRAQAALLGHLMVGSPLVMAPPAADSPVGKSECCAAPMDLELVGYAEPAADEPPPAGLVAHLPSRMP
jgi:hypothetical protein